MQRELKLIKYKMDAQKHLQCLDNVSKFKLTFLKILFALNAGAILLFPTIVTLSDPYVQFSSFLLSIIFFAAGLICCAILTNSFINIEVNNATAQQLELAAHHTSIMAQLENSPEKEAELSQLSAKYYRDASAEYRSFRYRFNVVIFPTIMGLLALLAFIFGCYHFFNIYSELTKQVITAC